MNSKTWENTLKISGGFSLCLSSYLSLFVCLFVCLKGAGDWTHSDNHGTVIPSLGQTWSQASQILPVSLHSQLYDSFSPFLFPFFPWAFTPHSLGRLQELSCVSLGTEQSNTSLCPAYQMPAPGPQLPGPKLSPGIVKAISPPSKETGHGLGEERPRAPPKGIIKTPNSLKCSITWCISN